MCAYMCTFVKCTTLCVCMYVCVRACWQACVLSFAWKVGCVCGHCVCVRVCAYVCVFVRKCAYVCVCVRAHWACVRDALVSRVCVVRGSEGVRERLCDCVCL